MEAMSSEKMPKLDWKESIKAGIERLEAGDMFCLNLRKRCTLTQIGRL